MTLTADVEVRRGAFELSAALRCDNGELLVLIGPNGAGKTTLLRALAGLEPLSQGSVSLGEKVLSDLERGISVPPAERDAGVLFADLRLFPHMTVSANIAFGRRVTGADDRRARERLTSLLAQLQISELSRSRPSELSAGQAQRVALLRAVARQPSYLLLDEPFAALDAQTRPLVRRWLTDCVARLDIPCVLVSHDPIDALTIAARVLVLEHGQVTQDGTPSEIARHPASEYVARLVGLNLYTGELASDGLHVDGGGHIVCATSLAPGRVNATVRPSAVTLYLQRPVTTSARNVWRGPVTSVDPMGERCRVAVGSVPPVIVELTTTALADMGIRAGTEVWVSFKATDVDLAS